ncbi:immunoglobulin superfamily member 10 [Melanerpes formicivorus]|uniref:immunoglobulin superfamily member 10 n=1 Tax=Melanerpes formicivorus TaxID=211600 RepID=UPI00358F3C4D
MTDQAGSRGDLVCSLQKPQEMSPISFDEDASRTVLKTSFSAVLVCGTDAEHIQQLWSILALYSNSPLKLERTVPAAGLPAASYRYRQVHPDKDELFTSIEAELRAEPSWLMQSQVALQLDRTATTLTTLHLHFSTEAQIVLAGADKKQARSSWTLISRDNQTQTEHTVLVGGTVELECQASGEPAPAVEWILADGSKVRAPYLSEDGRISVVGSGALTLRPADTFDTGLYHCVSTNGHDADTLTFRITVVDAHVEPTSVNGAQLAAAAGSTLHLPCTSSAAPAAAVSWVLPQQVVLQRSRRNKQVLDNGTLRIEGVTERDSGYFRCVAANQYGVDLLVFQVLVRKEGAPLKEKHEAVGGWEEGEGSGNALLASATTQTQPSATPPPSRAHQGSAASAPSSRAAPSARERSSPRTTTHRHYRDRTSRRLRGRRRQFVSSARRVDPQRWAAFLERTKRNSTLMEKQGEVAAKPPPQVPKSSEVPGDEEEASGDLRSPEEEFMMPVTERATLSPLGRAMGSVRTEGPEVTTSNTPASRTSLLVAVTPLPSPFSQPVPSDSRKPQTYLIPTTTTPWERADPSETSANDANQSAAADGATRTARLLPAGQRWVPTGESNNQHLNPMSTTPMTDVTATSKSGTPQTTMEKLSTDPVGKTPTQTGHQVSVVTVSEPSPEFDDIHFYQTQEQVTPKPPEASASIIHQQPQLVQEAAAHTAQAQPQPGRRRKTPGRRRIVRPGRAPSEKEHSSTLGRPGSGAAGVVLNVKYVPDLPGFDHLSSSISPVSPEAPLSSPSTVNVPLEHPVGTPQSTAFLSEENDKPSAKQQAAPAVLPLRTEGTQGTPQWQLESSAPFQTNTNRVQASSLKLPLIHPAATATETTHTSSTKIPPTLDSVPPSIEPRTSPEDFQRGKTTWEPLFENRAPKEVLKEQTDVFPAPEAWTTLPKTTAALTKRPPLHFVPTSTGGSHSSGFLSSITPIPSGNGEAEQHPPTTEPHSYPHPASSMTKVVDGESLKPTVTPVTAPQTNPKITKSKAFRAGRKRGQRRKRPPKTSAHSMTVSHSTPASPPGSTATLTVTAAGSSPLPAGPTPAGPTPAELLSASASRGLVTGTPAHNTPEAPQHVPTAASPFTPQDTPSVTSPRDGHAAQSPTAPIQTTPRLSEPPSTTGTQPAAAGSEPAQQIKATTMVGGKSYLEMEESIAQEDHVAQDTSTARNKPRASAAASTDTTPRSTQHPTPPLAATEAVPPTHTARTTPPPRQESSFWQKPSAEVTEGANLSPISALTMLTSPLVAAPRGRDEDGPVQGWSEKRQDQEPTTFSRSHFSKPRIIGGQSAAFTVLANSDAFIPCEATGNPRPTIHWTKIASGPGATGGRGDGGRDGRWQVFANGTLAIARAGLGDRGQYLCTASSPLGTARLLLTLSVVAYPPRIAGARRQFFTAHSGGPVAVQCRAEGRPPPAISWVLANQTRISHASPGSTKAHVEADGTLVIREVSVYDRGLYTCLAENPAGTDTLVVKLQVVAAPPAILEERRQRLEAALGESLMLPCTVKGNPQPSVHWVLFDGTVVKPLQLVKAKLFLFANGTLHLSHAAPSDSGNYECIATSSTGSERRVVSLLVQRRDAPPRIAAASQEMTRLSFGDKLLLNCTATGEPKPRIIWRLPTKAVVDQWHRMGSRIHVYPNGSLAIEAVTEKDAGDYLCVARNHLGEDLTLLRVSVAMTPAKIDQKQHLKKLVPYGKDFRVDCKASGSPAPEISWGLPDGTVVNNAMLADDGGHRAHPYILFDNGTLYLQTAGAAAGGDYTCYAQNTLGRDEMKVRVTVVAAAPRIKHGHQTHLRVEAGGTALLDCQAAGQPEPKIFWLLPSGQTISSSTARHLLHPDGSLAVSQVKLADAGQYLCVARNPGGDDTKLYKLEVAAKPPTINGLHVDKAIRKVTAVRHTRKHIDCRAEGSPPPQIMWIVPGNIFLTAPYYGSRLMVHENGTLEIRNVRASDAAEFVCVVRNEAGESRLLVQLEVAEMLRRPTFKNPFNEKVTVTPGKATTLNCSVDGHPPPEVSWMLPNGTWFPRGISTPQLHTGSEGTLTIRSPSADTAGRYRCAARNQLGYIEKLIVVEVGRKPNILTRSVGPVKAVSGEPLALHCLSDGSPKPSTSWVLPTGQVLAHPQAGRRHILLENGTLIIREAAAHDGGDYVCKVRSGAGEDSVTVAVAVVAFPPRITSRPPRTIHTMPGAALQLHCSALGIPKPEISWELPDGSVLSPGHRGQAAERLLPPGTLLIRSPRPSDSGVYKCTARSRLGSDLAVTYLHVI